jgi:hypothetical protein
MRSPTPSASAGSLRLSWTDLAPRCRAQQRRSLACGRARRNGGRTFTTSWSSSPSGDGTRRRFPPVGPSTWACRVRANAARSKSPSYGSPRLGSRYSDRSHCRPAPGRNPSNASRPGGALTGRPSGSRQFNGGVGHAAPLRPGAVIDADVVALEQVGENEPGRGSASADRAVRDQLVVSIAVDR